MPGLNAKPRQRRSNARRQAIFLPAGRREKKFVELGVQPAKSSGQNHSLTTAVRQKTQ
jgi:hypothetical protein